VLGLVKKKSRIKFLELQGWDSISNVEISISSNIKYLLWMPA
jgi:hypothetical protein